MRQQQMISLVIEPPLTYDEIGSCGLYLYMQQQSKVRSHDNHVITTHHTHLFNHLIKFFPFIHLKLLVVLHRGDMEAVLGLGLGRFKRASQDGNLGIPN